MGISVEWVFLMGITKGISKGDFKWGFHMDILGVFLKRGFYLGILNSDF